MKFLIEHNANFEIPTENGNTPLMWASHTGSINVLEYLLSKKAVITNLNRDGYNALDLAISRMNYPCALLLYNHGGELRSVEEYKLILRFEYDIEMFLIALRNNDEAASEDFFLKKRNNDLP